MVLMVFYFILFNFLLKGRKGEGVKVKMEGKNMEGKKGLLIRYCLQFVLHTFPKTIEIKNIHSQECV